MAEKHDVDPFEHEAKEKEAKEAKDKEVKPLSIKIKDEIKNIGEHLGVLGGEAHTGQQGSGTQPETGMSPEPTIPEVPQMPEELEEFLRKAKKAIPKFPLGKEHTD